MESLATDITDFQHTLQRGQAEVRKEALGALGKLTEQAFGEIFSKGDFMSPFYCIFSYIEKH